MTMRREFYWRRPQPLPARTGSRFPRCGILLLAFLLLGTESFLGETACEPPLSMKAQLQGSPKATAYTELGVWFASQKQFACAADAFATSLQMDSAQPDVAHVAFMFGVSLYYSGNTGDAIAALQEAEKLGFHDIKLHIILATLFDSSHSIKDAEDEWGAALALDPESTTALDALSGDLFLENDFNGIIALLESPRLLGQRTEQQSLRLGLAYAGSARLEEAAGTLRDGLNTSPDSLALANNLATVLVQLHRQNEAAAVLEVALAQHPGNPDTAIHYLGTLMAAQPEKAPGAASKLLLAFPQNAKLLYLNGILDMKGGNLQQARAHLEQALALLPDEALSHEALGVVLAQLNEMAGAKEHLERAIALGDNNPEVKENLARVLRALGSGK
jgi:Flp pilus assembly protein TadD